MEAIKAIVGLLILVIAFGISIWLKVYKNAEREISMHFFLFAFFTGAFLIMSETVTEITVNNIGSIRTEREKAISYNKEISEINEEIKKIKNDALDQLNKIKEELKKTQKMAEPNKILYSDYEIISNEPPYKIYIKFKTTKDIPLGDIMHDVKVLTNDPKVKIIALEPYNLIGFQTLDHSISSDGKTATLKYAILGHGAPGMFLTLSQKTRIKISGNYGLEPKEVNIK